MSDTLTGSSIDPTTGAEKSKSVAIDAGLANAALSAYLEASAVKPKSWLSHPNNLISVVAICLSIMGVVYGFYKDWRSGIDKDLQSLSTLVVDLTKLDTEALNVMRAPGAAPTATVDAGLAAANFEQARTTELGRAITNRRLTLMAEADRLTNNLGKHAPSPQLAVLATSYAQIFQFEKAKRYFEAITKDETSAAMRLTGWRSLAIVNMNLGPAQESATRDAFAKAIAVDPNPKDYGSIGLLIEVYLQSADFEFAYRKYDAAFRQLAQANNLATQVPCASGGATAEQRVRASIASKLSFTRQVDAPIDATLSEEAGGALTKSRC